MLQRFYKINNIKVAVESLVEHNYSLQFAKNDNTVVWPLSRCVDNNLTVA